MVAVELKRIGNDAIEMEFCIEGSAWMPARLINRLARTEISLSEATFGLVLETDGKKVTLWGTDMHCTGIRHIGAESITCENVHNELGISLRMTYSIDANTIRQFTEIRNISSRAITVRDVVLLQAVTETEIQGQASNIDFTLGDSGSLSADTLKKVDAHPLFLGGTVFIGIDWPVAENAVQGRLFRCTQFAGETLASGESFILRPLSIGASLPDLLPQTFLQHLKRLRGRETRRASMYFDWLVHASEGLKEVEYDQLLDYFVMLKKEFDIRFDIFCSDDGIFETRWATTFDLYQKQHESLFPQGFKRMSDRMKSIGMEAGVWLGPDGFGETEVEEHARIDTVASLVREHGIGIIKMDTVVSRPVGDDPYRNERYMRKLERLVDACHEANPDIIIINHRISASPYILTMLDSTLWMGAESYPDHFLYNDDKPRLFTRFGSFGRGEPTYYGAYSELLEDHGVCFNGFTEGWREELVVQALGRALMLAPEIYGTLFLLPDEDYRDLAKIMKLVEQFSGLLTRTKYEVATGDFIHADGERALLCLVNDNWETKERELRINAEIGINGESARYEIICHFPFPEEVPNTWYAGWGGSVKVQLSPFQVCVLEIRPATMQTDDLMDTQSTEPVVIATLPQQRMDRASISLGTFTQTEIREEDEITAELIRFQISSDPTEAQVLDRNEASQYDEVNACRQFFRNKLRKECFAIATNAWDGDPVTAWGDSPFWNDGDNVWRLDTGALNMIARVEVTLAELGPGPVIEWGKGRSLPRSVVFEVSADAKEWHAAEATLYYRRQPIEPRTVAQRFIASFDELDRPMRYIRMHVRGILAGDIRVQTWKNGVLTAIPTDSWRGNNLLTARNPSALYKKSFMVDEAWDGRYAAVVVELPDGPDVWLKQEIAIVWVEATDGRVWPVTEASPAYPFGGWEGNANRRARCWTFRLLVTPGMCGLPLTFRLAWFGPKEEAYRQEGSPLPLVSGYIVAVK
jgi:hypothetical protein